MVHACGQGACASHNLGAIEAWCMHAARGHAPETNLGATIAAGQLPGGHATAGEGRDLVRVVDAAHPKHIILIRRVVQGPIQWPIVTNRAHHYDAVARDLPHLQNHLLFPILMDHVRLALLFQQHFVASLYPSPFLSLLLHSNSVGYLPVQNKLCC